MIRKSLPFMALALACIAVVVCVGGCPAAGTSPTQTNESVGTTNTSGSNTDVGGTGDTPASSNGTTTDAGGATPGILQVKAYTDSLGATTVIGVQQSAQQSPDDINVDLTPTACSIAFKRIVLKQVDEATNSTPVEREVFVADTAAHAKIVDLGNASAADVLNVADLPAGVYNKVDIEVFYLDMTIATLYPGSTSHNIQYRMVFDNMGLLRQRDLLLWLEPAWMTGSSQLSAAVTQAGWYWMQREDPDHVMAVAGAAASPTFNVLDLFANDAFWSSTHKLLEGGRISPPLTYDPAAGAVVTINFDVRGTFNFKDYHDATTQPDGLWEIRRDSGIHPFPPDYTCVPADTGKPGETPPTGTK